MKAKLLFSLGALLLARSAHAQFLWSERVASATTWPEEPNIGLALDANDNCYVTGWFDGTNDFGGVTLTNQSAGGSDIFVAKYNASGALQWVQCAGGTSSNYGRGVGTDANGNVYVGGSYQGPASFNGINLPATSGEEYFLAKYNNAGAVQWVRSSTGGSDQNYGIGLTVDSAGNSYALVVMDDSGTSLTFGSTTVTTANYGHTLLILVKYDNTGTAQWAQLFDSSQETYGSKVAVDAAGNVYVCGTFDSDMEIGTSNLVGNAGSKNIFVAKFNSAGALVWVQQPKGDSSAGEGGVAVDPEGNVYISGAFTNTLNFGSGIILTNTANASSLFGDTFVAKYNNVGAIQWAQSAGGVNGGFYWDIALDAQTNIYAAGYLGYNAAVSKYVPAGALQWAYSATGQPANPIASGVAKCAVDSGGDCYLAGFYQGSATFGANTLKPQETWNIFLTEVATNPGVQFSANPSSGVAPLIVQFNSTSVDSQGNAVTSWDWSFGDGTTSANQNPSHTYTMTGVFHPSLTATNDKGTLVIGIGNPTIVVTNPVVQFTASPTNGAMPLSVQFHSPPVDGQGNTIISWNWHFDDGTSSTNQNPSHTYTATGTFYPNLTVTNENGIAVVGLGPTIVATPGPPTAIIQPTNAVIATWAGSNVVLAVSVKGTGPFSYQWRLNGTNLPNGVITTVAGGGIGDGGAAVNAGLNPPSVAVDAAGNLFIPDTDDNRIRKVSTKGIITSIAGNGNYGYSGDGGAATNASLENPSGVALDAAGNLFIADTDNNRVRKVDTNGIITTVAGNGSNGYSGDGGAATNAKLDYPSGVAVDAAGNLFIADTDNNRIRKVDTNGIITTVVGNGSGGYSGDGGSGTNASLGQPSCVAVDATGNLFIADTSNNRIRKVDTNGIITTVAGNGSVGYSGDGAAATNASLDLPYGVTVDAAGNLFVADTHNNRIRLVDTNGILTTFAGNSRIGYSGDGGAATNARLYYPADVAVDAGGNLFIADTLNNRIRKVSANGIITTVAGNGSLTCSGDGAAAISASLYLPEGVAVDTAGNLFIADTDNNRIRKVSANGVITTVAGNGTAGYSGDGGAATSAGFNYPTSVAVDAAGNLIIADTENNRIRQVSTNGVISTVAGNGSSDFFYGDGGAATNASINYPSAVALDAFRNLFIADTKNNRIREVSTNGIITTVAGNGDASYSGDGGLARSATLYDPTGVAVNAAGNLFIADTWNNRIREVSTNGIITTVAGSAGLSHPSGIAMDAFGNLFIADGSLERILKDDTNGIITIIAGNGNHGYSGDGGAATNASLWDPSGVAVDAAGNLFIADSENNRIRKVTPPGGAMLLLDKVGIGSAGAYDVVVSSPYGSVTSSVVNVTVTLPQIILAAPQMTLGKTDFMFQLSGPAGSNYVLEASTNLLNWSSVSTSSVPITGSITLTNAIGPHNNRFYRVHLQ